MGWVGNRIKERSWESLALGFVSILAFCVMMVIIVGLVLEALGM